MPGICHTSRRKEFWSLPVWEASIANTEVNRIDLSQWPKAPLDQQLIDSYFEHDNLALPLLNRKLFQRDYDKGRFKEDRGYARSCLLVFANAAKMFDDPAVFWYANDKQKEQEAMQNMDIYRHSAGWRWLSLAMRGGSSILAPVFLEDLQCCVVSCARAFVFMDKGRCLYNI